ncbi:MAG: hypothetical protein HQM09_21570 [Candidatus Riflebacteria bacterium]|nr:hypothetical protein [Candidatus Riflebacteria bacterium]
MGTIFTAVLLYVFLGCSLATAFGAEPERVIFSKRIPMHANRGGEISVTMDWLERPGEFALTITYWGQLTQEGPVNVWMNLNGVERGFVTLTELPDRHQMVRILSYQPTATNADGGTILRSLEDYERVDIDFFSKAGYYTAFGQNRLECKFFVNGRWEGDPGNNDSNYVFTFIPPVS